MADIVVALGTSHSPGITGFPERADQLQADAVYNAFAQARERLEAARPEALVAISVEHFTNFFLDNFPALAIATSEEYVGPPNENFEAFLRVPRRSYPGASSLGAAIYRHAIEHEFDPALVGGDFVFDENFCVPLSLLTPQVALPMVPVIVNGVNPPYPSLRRCYGFGQAIGEAIADDDSVERVGLLATGGLSHWVGMPQSGTINEPFDKRLLAALESGDRESLLGLSDEDIDLAGNGAHEIRALAVLWGALGEAAFDVLAYEPIPAWLTGTWVAVCQEGTRLTPVGQTQGGKRD